MYMVLSVFITLALFVPHAFGETWSYGGRSFRAADDLFLMSPELLTTSAKAIADHIKYLKENFLKDIDEEFEVVFASTSGADALFFPPGTHEDSTGKMLQSAVIQINPRVLSGSKLFRLLGHEIFHYIHDKRSPNEQSWIREGLAQNFEHDVYGGISQTHLRGALSESRHALEEDFDISDISAERYGNTFLFFHFLEQNCLVDKAWKLALDDAMANVSGRQGLVRMLAHSESKSFNCLSVLDAMSEFTIQKLINSQSPVHPMALWPLLDAMEPMDSEGQVLRQLSRADLRRFFDQLPPFLGFKISAEVWTPVATHFSAIQFWYWSEAGQVLLPWSERPQLMAEDAQVLFFKKR